MFVEIEDSTVYKRRFKNDIIGSSIGILAFIAVICFCFFVLFDNSGDKGIMTACIVCIVFSIVGILSFGKAIQSAIEGLRRLRY